jgi:hypothetical protein
MSATNPSHSSAIIGHSVSEPSSSRTHFPSENLAENDEGIAVSAPNLRQRGVWVVANSVLPTSISAELQKYAPSRVCEKKTTEHTTGAPLGTVLNVNSYFGPSNRKKRAHLKSNQMDLKQA